MNQTEQQLRASHSHNEVREIIKKHSKKTEEFKSYANAFAPMILMNGLGQASAFYLSKDGMHKELYNLLSRWFTKEGRPYAGKENLMDGITQGDRQQYLLAQAEALLLLDWVKNFANAYVKKLSMDKEKN